MISAVLIALGVWLFFFLLNFLPEYANTKYEFAQRAEHSRQRDMKRRYPTLFAGSVDSYSGKLEP